MTPDETNQRKLILKVVADVFCLLIVSIPILLFYLMGEPYKRGFFCDDLSIRHPYKDSTVPSWALYIYCLGLPIVMIILTEVALFSRSNKEKVLIFNIEMPSWIWECYRHVSVFGFGAACSQLTTDIAKYSIGRLRPHFYSLCKPDFDCDSPKNRFTYVENYSCTSVSGKYLMKDMRLSFPSGHSSFSTYCMIFLVGYIQYKIQWKEAKLFKHLLQFIAISLAFYTALSRISDYKHHWSDVLAGAVQGLIVAVLIVRYVSDLVPSKSHRRRGSFQSDPDASDNGMKMDDRGVYNSRRP